MPKLEKQIDDVGKYISKLAFFESTFLDQRPQWKSPPSVGLADPRGVRCGGGAYVVGRKEHSGAATKHSGQNVGLKRFCFPPDCFLPALIPPPKKKK